MFLLSFLALGSLRFRVRKGLRHKRMNDYRLVEHGSLEDGAAFQRFSCKRPVQSWAEHLATSPEARLAFNSVLQKSPYQAFFWETKSTAKDAPMEFVLIDAPSLLKFAEGSPDNSTFAPYFRLTDASVVTVENLGKDAQLVVPRDQGATSSHLASFVRGSPPEAVDALWKQVGLSFLQQSSTMPTWLSTDGRGIAWLHVRLDSRPKYYKYAPYK